MSRVLLRKVSITLEDRLQVTIQMKSRSTATDQRIPESVALRSEVGILFRCGWSNRQADQARDRQLRLRV